MRSILLMVLLILFGGCSKYEEDLHTLQVLDSDNNVTVLSINKRLDESVYEQVSVIESKRIDVVATSPGGDVFPSAKLAVLFASKDTNLNVIGYCISACAEFLLPSASSINFTDNPIIAFHWGPIMDYEQYKRAKVDLGNCHFPSYVIQKDLFERKSLNYNFWKQIEDRLKLDVFRLTWVDGPQECPWKVREFSNSYWLPNSIQLRELMGLKFNGSVCADNMELCKEKLNRYWPGGVSLVVGDGIYVTGS